MKRTIAVLLSLMLMLTVLPVSVFAASQSFYVPTRIVETRVSDDGAENKYTTILTYDAKSKTLMVDTSNLPDGEFQVPSDGASVYLSYASTDHIANRFLEEEFEELGTTYRIERFFTNDLARYGKMKKLVFQHNGRVTGEYTFTAKNNKVTACRIHFPGDESLKWINESYNYNNVGNISQFTQTINGERLTARFQYDSKNRPSSYTVNNGYSTSAVKFSNYTAEGLPQNSTGERNVIWHYSFNGKKQLTQYAWIADGVSNVSNYSYDSQGRLQKMSTSDAEYVYSHFQAI